MADNQLLDQNTANAKNLAWWLYLIHAASFFFSLGLFSFVPLIINYVKRGDTVGTFVVTHHNWQIRSFWWYVFWMVVGAICFATFILIPVAWVIWPVVWLWKAYRLIRGWIDLNDNKPMPN